MVLSMARELILRNMDRGVASILMLPGVSFLQQYVLFPLPLDGNNNRVVIRNARMCVVMVNKGLSEGMKQGEE